MSFKRKFNTPTKMAPGNHDDDEDDVTTRRDYDFRPSSARAADSSADCWPSTSTTNVADAALFPNAFADADRLFDFRTRYGPSVRKSPAADRDVPTPLPDRERNAEMDRGGGGDPWRQPEADGDDDVMENIRSVIGSAATLEEKQRVLSAMISQLQSLKQNLFRQKSNNVNIQSFVFHLNIIY